MNCLVFENRQSAQIAIGQICMNTIRRDWDSIKMIDKNGQDILSFADFYALSDEDKYQCKQLGKNALTGEWNYQSGFTTSYAVEQQIYNDTKYWIPKPDENLMEYVEGYEILEYQDDWNPPINL